MRMVVRMAIQIAMRMVMRIAMRMVMRMTKMRIMTNHLRVVHLAQVLIPHLDYFGG